MRFQEIIILSLLLYYIFCENKGTVVADTYICNILIFYNLKIKLNKQKVNNLILKVVLKLIKYKKPQ